MADWTTISSLATAGGTLVLAVATYSAVRSSNRSSRIAERAIQVGMRPVIMSSPSKMGRRRSDGRTTGAHRHQGTQRFTVDLLYSDHEGRQRAISRMALVPRQESGWMCTVGRVWNLDRQDPR